MGKKCKICGTTENVNFDGMCKKCYNDSIILHEKNAEEIKREEIEDKRKRRENFDFTWIQIVIVIIFIIVVAYTLGKNDNSSNNTVNNVSSNSSSTISKNSANVSTKIEKTKVTVIDFSQMTKDEIQNWCNTNKVICSIIENYSDTVEKGAFVSQSINANSMIYEGDRITITYSLGKEPTMGQKNALSKAKDYLRIMAFSYKGLIEQLEYEGYSTEEATYGADNCGSDWNEQAAKKAKAYIDMMSFSRSGLIEQLKYEGFTNEQAEYGATSVGY